MNNPPRNILVTGAGSGLGQGLCLALAQSGHRIFAADLNVDGARETVAQVEAAGGRGTAYALDVTSPESVAQCIEEIGAKNLGVLINSAGLQHVAKIEEFPIEKWRELMGVLVDGAFLMTRAVLPGMRANGFGRIINIGSIHSVVASPYKSAYVAAKHALIGFSKTVALESARWRYHHQHDLPLLYPHAAGRQTDRGAGGYKGHLRGGSDRSSNAEPHAEKGLHYL